MRVVSVFIFSHNPLLRIFYATFQDYLSQPSWFSVLPRDDSISRFIATVSWIRTEFTTQGVHMPEISLSRGVLFRVSLLLSLSFLVSAFGTYVGAGITSGAVMIVLMIAFFAGAFAVPYMARSSKELGLLGLAGWTFISGLFLGPTIHAYVHILGWQTVFLAYLGTGGVMAVCGILGAFSGLNFSRMGWWLTIALLGLILFGLITSLCRLVISVTCFTRASAWSSSLGFSSSIFGAWPIRKTPGRTHLM